MYEVQDYVLLPSLCQEGELLLNVAMLLGVECYIQLPENQELQTTAKISILFLQLGIVCSFIMSRKLFSYQTTTCFWDQAWVGH